MTETLPTGWDLTGINCSGDTDGTFTLTPGQTVICVFTDPKRVPPTIEKWQRNLDAGGNLTRNAIDAQVGDRIVYELRVTNPGPGAATRIVVDDLIPDRMRVTSRGICTGGLSDLQVCDLGSFAPGQTKTVTIEARIYLGCTVVGSRGADTLGESIGGGVYDDGVTDGPDVICGVGGGDTMLFGQGGQDQIFGDQPLPVPSAAP